MAGGKIDLRRTAAGVAAGVAAIVPISLLIGVLQDSADVHGLVGLYILAIVPVAVRWGLLPAGIVALAGHATFEYFFIPPIHSIVIGKSEAAVTIAISLGVAYVVSDFARRAQDRAREAELSAKKAEDAQGELQLLADEQAALRRVATLVARAAPTSEVFEAVTREVGLQCHADLARMERFEDDHAVTAIAAWSRLGKTELAVDERFSLEGTNIAAQVIQNGGPARVESFEGATGPIAREAEALGIRSSVGCPITVGGKVWGVIAASTRSATPFPPDTERSIADFTELVATAVANAEARAQLVASRARVLVAGDDARRRVVRDLHDGAQQRFVHAIITLKLARRALARGDADAEALVAEALEQAEQANTELRELAHGILPSTLNRGGLAAGVDSLIARLRMPANVTVPRERFPPEIEASAYFVVAEALTNVAKHAGAEHVDVTASVDDGTLRIDVRDDGVGGARPEGTGLLGLHDRVAALGGELRVESEPGRGTRVAATLPLR